MIFCGTWDDFDEETVVVDATEECAVGIEEVFAHHWTAGEVWYA